MESGIKFLILLYVSQNLIHLAFQLNLRKTNQLENYEIIFRWLLGLQIIQSGCRSSTVNTLFHSKIWQNGCWFLNKLKWLTREVQTHFIQQVSHCYVNAFHTNRCHILNLLLLCRHVNFPKKETVANHKNTKSNGNHAEFQMKSNCHYKLQFVNLKKCNKFDYAAKTTASTAGRRLQRRGPKGWSYGQTNNNCPTRKLWDMSSSN